MTRFGLRRSVMAFVIIVAALSFVLSHGQRRGEGAEVMGFPQSFADLVERVKPAVVNISTTSTVKVPGNPFKYFFGPGEEGFDDFWKRFFGDVPDREMKQRSLGSGFIIDKDGYIVTNNHVVAEAQEIKVKLADGREFDAKVIGRDEKTDLALMRISSPTKNLPFLTLGDSEKVRVGDWVLTIGNPFGLEHTVTQGIISATGRVIGAGPYDNFLQTDAPINPGNSGGPLINLKGEVIGINSAIVAGGQGIGFAIPITMVKRIVPQLREKGRVVRGWIGVTVQAVTPEMANALGLKDREGALVGDLAEQGPAETGGIRRGDVILSFDGKRIKTVADLPVLVADTPVGKTVPVKALRGGKELDVKLTVRELKDERAGTKAAPAKAAPAKASLGIRVTNITPQAQRDFGVKDKVGVVVVEVQPDSSADNAGIQAGDVVRQVNRKPVSDVKDYEAVMKGAEKGKPAVFLINRGGQTLYVTVTVP